jgi:hypothetical protein
MQKRPNEEKNTVSVEGRRRVNVHENGQNYLQKISDISQVTVAAVAAVAATAAAAAVKPTLVYI